jgi:hypothetical protein
MKADMTDADWERILSEEPPPYDHWGAGLEPKGGPEGEEADPRAMEGLADLPLPVELFADITPVLTRRALIKGLLLASTKVVIFGQEGCGKTFLVLDQLLHIAAGLPWFGRKVRQGPVVYIAAEGAAGVRLRVEAWKRKNGIDDLSFAIIPVAVDLLDPRVDLVKLFRVLDYLAELWGTPPVAIAIDTLSQTMGGGDENTSDMAAYIANCTRLTEPHRCATVIVHHQPLDAQTKRPRGHSSLAGAVDTMIHVEGREGTRRVTITKQKDLVRGDDIFFRLVPVELGVDEDGEAVTSCVVEEADAVDEPTTGPKLSPTRRIVLDALDRVTIREGFPPPISMPSGLIGHLTGKIVKLSAWHSEALSSLVTPDKNADSAARQFRRARDELQASKIIGVYDDFVWRNHT